jgi:hypothetical protein
VLIVGSIGVETFGDVVDLSGKFQERFPVKVDMSFEYRGQHYETSYLTVVTRRPNNPEVSTYRWDHGRDETGLVLQDRSVVVLGPAWGWGLQPYEPGKIYNSTGGWFWTDRARTPKLVIYGSSAFKISPQRSGDASFVSLDVKATISRAADDLLPQAEAADAAPDKVDKIGYSNNTGGNLKVPGSVYAGVDISPIRSRDPDSADGIDLLRRAPGWVAAGGGCRILSVFSRAEYSSDVTENWDGRHGLLPTGQVWSAEGGPHPSEPRLMYPTGKPPAPVREDSFSASDYTYPILSTVHAIERDGAVCGNINVLPNSSAFFVEFLDHTVMMVSPSDSFVIFKD